jgi:hypothetical protein
MAAMNPTRTLLKTMNFTVGFALLVMLFPIGEKLPEKPAGVRNAVELAAKKFSIRPIGVTGFSA